MANMLKRSEVSKITGVTRRSLQEYDSIDLLKPIINEKGHWYYRNADIGKLILIQIFVEAGYKRKEIKEILNRPICSEFNLYREIINKLEEKKRRINGFINTLGFMLEIEGLPEEAKGVLAGVDLSMVYSHQNFKSTFDSMIDLYSDYDGYEDDELEMYKIFEKISLLLYTVGIYSKNNPHDKLAQKAAEAVYGQIKAMFDFFIEKGVSPNNFQEGNFYDDADDFLLEFFWDNEEIIDDMNTKFDANVEKIKEALKIVKMNLIKRRSNET